MKVKKQNKTNQTNKFHYFSSHDQRIKHRKVTHKHVDPIHADGFSYLSLHESLFYPIFMKKKKKSHGIAFLRSYLLMYGKMMTNLNSYDHTIKKSFTYSSHPHVKFLSWCNNWSWYAIQFHDIKRKSFILHFKWSTLRLFLDISVDDVIPQITRTPNLPSQSICQEISRPFKLQEHKWDKLKICYLVLSITQKSSF